MTRRRSGATRPTSYQIVVRGELSQRFSTAFEGMTLVARDGQTTIAGPVADQAALHGLLAKVRDLGLELLEVRRTGPAGTDPEASDATGSDPKAERWNTAPPPAPGGPAAPQAPAKPDRPP